MSEEIDPKLSDRFDRIEKAIKDLSVKTASSEANLESKIEKLPERLFDYTCAPLSKQISTILVGMVFGIIAAFAIPTVVWMSIGRKIEVCEVWLFSILFVSFCAFGIVLIRILVRPND